MESFGQTNHDSISVGEFFPELKGFGNTRMVFRLMKPPDPPNPPPVQNPVEPVPTRKENEFLEAYVKLLGVDRRLVVWSRIAKEAYRLRETVGATKHHFLAFREWMDSDDFWRGKSISPSKVVEKWAEVMREMKIPETTGPLPPFPESDEIVEELSRWYEACLLNRPIEKLSPVGKFFQPKILPLRKEIGPDEIRAVVEREYARAKSALRFQFAS